MSWSPTTATFSCFCAVTATDGRGAPKRVRKRAREIGCELGAHYPVEGTVRRQDQRLRIAATLVRTRCCRMRCSMTRAVAEIERARAIDPLAPSMHTIAAVIYTFDRRHDAGFAAVRHALTLDPDHFQAHAVLGHLDDRS